MASLIDTATTAIGKIIANGKNAITGTMLNDALNSIFNVAKAETNNWTSSFNLAGKYFDIYSDFNRIYGTGGFSITDNSDVTDAGERTESIGTFIQNDPQLSPNLKIGKNNTYGSIDILNYYHVDNHIRLSATGNVIVNSGKNFCIFNGDFENYQSSRSVAIASFGESGNCISDSLRVYSKYLTTDETSYANSGITFDSDDYKGFIKAANYEITTYGAATFGKGQTNSGNYVTLANYLYSGYAINVNGDDTLKNLIKTCQNAQLIQEVPKSSFTNIIDGGYQKLLGPTFNDMMLNVIYADILVHTHGLTKDTIDVDTLGEFMAENSISCIFFCGVGGYKYINKAGQDSSVLLYPQNNSTFYYYVYLSKKFASATESTTTWNNTSGDFTFSTSGCVDSIGFYVAMQTNAMPMTYSNFTSLADTSVIAALAKLKNFSNTFYTYIDFTNSAINTTGNIIPSTTNKYNLGSNTSLFNTIYAYNISAIDQSNGTSTKGLTITGGVGSINIDNNVSISSPSKITIGYPNIANINVNGASYTQTISGDINIASTDGNLSTYSDYFYITTNQINISVGSNYLEIDDTRGITLKGIDGVNINPGDYGNNVNIGDSSNYVKIDPTDLGYIKLRTTYEPDSDNGGEITIYNSSYTGMYLRDYNIGIVNSKGTTTIGNTSSEPTYIKLENSSANITVHAYCDLNLEAEEELYLKAAEIIANHTISISSDIRYKTVLQDLTLSLEDIANAPFFEFEYNEHPDTIEVGTSAQYWKEVCPNAVKSINNKYSLNYSGLALGAATSVAKEVVELKEKIENLSSENLQLQNKVVSLTSEIDTLKNELNELKTIINNLK
jgi:hypothetical protein